MDEKLKNDGKIGAASDMFVGAIPEISEKMKEAIIRLEGKNFDDVKAGLYTAQQLLTRVINDERTRIETRKTLRAVHDALVSGSNYFEYMDLFLKEFRGAKS